MKAERMSQWKKDRISYLMLAPYLLLFLLFTVVPVFISIGLSFTSYNLFENKKEFDIYQNGYIAAFHRCLYEL